MQLYQLFLISILTCGFIHSTSWAGKQTAPQMTHSDTDSNQPSISDEDQHILLRAAQAVLSRTDMKRTLPISWEGDLRISFYRLLQLLGNAYLRVSLHTREVLQNTPTWEALRDFFVRFTSNPFPYFEQFPSKFSAEGSGEEIRSAFEEMYQLSLHATRLRNKYQSNANPPELNGHIIALLTNLKHTKSTNKIPDTFAEQTLEELATFLKLLRALLLSAPNSINNSGPATLSLELIITLAREPILRSVASLRELANQYPRLEELLRRNLAELNAISTQLKEWDTILQHGSLQLYVHEERFQAFSRALRNDLDRVLEEVSLQITQYFSAEQTKDTVEHFDRTAGRVWTFQNTNSHIDYFEEHHVQADGDCGFRALGLTRQEAIEQLQEHIDDEEVRHAIAHDIFAALVASELSPLVGVFRLRLESLSEEYQALQEEIDSLHREHPDADASIFEALQTRQHEIRNTILDRISERGIVLRFISIEFQNSQRYLSYVPEGRGTMWALAHINNIDLHIWTQQTQANEGLLLRPIRLEEGLSGRELHVLHDLRGMHFNTLVPIGSNISSSNSAHNVTSPISQPHSPSLPTGLIDFRSISRGAF